MNSLPALETGFLQINGANLYFEVAGSGSPLVFIHAGVADSRMWDPQFVFFAQHFKVVRFDLRGFGRSDLPSGRFSHYEDVAGLLKALKVPRAHLVACSFGGLVALDFALAYPERVRSLMLVAPSVGGAEPSERIQQFWEAEDAALERGDLEAATEINLRLWVDGPARSPGEVDPEVREKVGAMQLNIFQKPVPQDIEELDLQPPALARLGEIKAPALLVAGELDLEEKRRTLDLLAREIPAARQAILPGGAHIITMEQPDAFNRIALDFLMEKEAR